MRLTALAGRWHGGEAGNVRHARRDVHTFGRQPHPAPPRRPDVGSHHADDLGSGDEAATRSALNPLLRPDRAREGGPRLRRAGLRRRWMELARVGIIDAVEPRATARSGRILALVVEALEFGVEVGDVVLRPGRVAFGVGGLVPPRRPLGRPCGVLQDTAQPLGSGDSGRPGFLLDGSPCVLGDSDGHHHVLVVDAVAASSLGSVCHRGSPMRGSPKCNTDWYNCASRDPRPE